MISASFNDVSLMRHFIGLDHLHRSAQAAQDNYPPYNIEQIGEDNYVLTLAVAGFAEHEIDISLLNSILAIKGARSTPAANSVFLHRGLSFRDFTRTFTLAEHIQVSSADLRDGILTVHLERRVPDSAKPKRIPIGALVQSLEKAPVSDAETPRARRHSASDL